MHSYYQLIQSRVMPYIEYPSKPQNLNGNEANIKVIEQLRNFMKISQI